MLAWEDAERILRLGRYFWIATTDADSAPHLVQQWAAWVDGALYFEGSERTRWARNLARDPRVGFGTQTGTRAVMAEGIVDLVRGVDAALAGRIAARYAAKYGPTFGYRPRAESYVRGHAFRARATKLIAFDVKRFNTSATRFTFSL